MKTSAQLTLISFIALAAAQDLSVVQVDNGVTTTLTGAAASSWQSSFDAEMSSNLAPLTSSCFPFCDDSTAVGASTTDALEGSSLASSISAAVASATGIINASSLASSISAAVASDLSSVSDAVASATEGVSSSRSATATASGNGAARIGGSALGVAGWCTVLLPLSAGVIGVAAILL